MSPELPSELPELSCVPGTLPPTSNRLQRLLGLLRDTIFLDVNRSVSEKFGDLRAQQLKHGQMTPDMDLLIAATAMVHNLTVVTHNQKHFATVPGLSLQDWLTM